MQLSEEEPESATRNRRIARTVVVVIVVLALLYSGHLYLLNMNATEGDVPSASAVTLPAGAEILSESRECASGGCWTVLEVQPPAGQTPEALAEAVGATPQLEIPGDFLDPRSTWVSARPSGGVLTLVLDYWSQEWVP